MEKDPKTVAPLREIDFRVLRDSVTRLADCIEFIATGRADDNHDSDAWEVRLIGGKCLYRLRLILNEGDLSATSCDLDTISLLEDIWRWISPLTMRDDREGPLFLTHEYSPEGDYRKADEEYLGIEGLVSGLVDSFPHLREGLMETKESNWAWLADSLREYAQRFELELEARIVPEPATILAGHVPVNGDPETTETDDDGVTPLADTASYLPGVLAKELGVTTGTLRRYAKAAKVKNLPGVGGKNQAYSPEGWEKILLHCQAGVGVETKIAEKARRVLLGIKAESAI